MKIAHLILTHKNPQQLDRLIRCLNHPAFEFYVHIDKKVAIEDFEYLKKYQNVHFIQKRTKIYWAGFGTIQATINGFEELAPLNFDYINVISGQDFPIKRADFIYQYILDRKGTEFITCESIDDEWKTAAVRVRQYHLINWKIPGKFRLEKLANKILPQRVFPLPHKIVGRANWFTLSNEAVKFSLQFLKDHPEVVRYYKYCWGADEFIFSTILYNSRFKDRIADNLVYVDRTGRTDGHPRILIAEDFDRLKASEKLFARKFDMDIDSLIFSKLESHLGLVK